MSKNNENKYLSFTFGNTFVCIPLDKIPKGEGKFIIYDSGYIPYNGLIKVYSDHSYESLSWVGKYSKGYIQNGELVPQHIGWIIDYDK